MLASVACVAVSRFQRAVKLGTEPVPLPVELPSARRPRWRGSGGHGGTPEFLLRGPGGNAPDLVAARPGPDRRRSRSTGRHSSRSGWPGGCGRGRRGGRRADLADRPKAGRRPWELALSWFVSSYPLLGGLAARFTIVADAELARGWDISVAAVSAAPARST